MLKTVAGVSQQCGGGLTPFYWLVDLTGRRYDAPTTYPHFFYGFFAVALVLQILAFVKTRMLPGSR